MSRVRSEGHAPSPCPLFLLLHLGRELVGGREMLCAEIEMRERERETERQRQVEGEGRLHPGHFLSLYLLVALPEAVGPLAGGARVFSPPLPQPSLCPLGAQVPGATVFEAPRSATAGPGLCCLPPPPDGLWAAGTLLPQWAVRVWGLSSRPT